MKLNRHQAQSLRTVLFNSSFTTKNTQSTFPTLKDRILTNNSFIDLKYAHLHLIHTQVKCPNKCLKVTKCFLEITTKRWIILEGFYCKDECNIFIFAEILINDYEN